MASAVDNAGRRIGKKGEPKFARYAEKDVTPVIDDYVIWLKANTGVDVDPQSVFLGSALRGEFQKSPENQKRIADRRVEIEEEAEARAQRAEERAAKKAAPKAKAVVKEKGTRSPGVHPAKTAAQAKTTRVAAKPSAPVTKSAPAKAGTTRRRPVGAKGSKADF